MAYNGPNGMGRNGESGMRTRKQQQERDALAKVLRPLRLELSKATANDNAIRRAFDWDTDPEGDALRGASRRVINARKAFRNAQATPRPDQVAWKLIQRARFYEECAEDKRQCNPSYTSGIARNMGDASTLRKQASEVWPPIVQRQTA